MRKITKNHITITGLLFFCFSVLFMALPAWTWADGENTIVYGLNTQYVVWHDNTTDDGNYDIFFKKSLDGGETWEEPYQNISNNSGNSKLPSIAVNGPNLYVVWQDNTYCSVRNPEGDNEVFFTRSTDGGVTWDPYRNLSNNVSDSWTWGISIAVDGSKLYVVWTDSEGVTPPEGEDPPISEYPPNEIFFMESLDSGDTWDDQPTKISNVTSRSGRRASRASMAVDGSNIYVVWQDTEVLWQDGGYYQGDRESFFNISRDGGDTWLEEPTYLGEGMCPVIAIDGQYLYVIRGGVNFTWSKDYGATWEQDVDLGNGMEPFIAVDGSNIYAVWHGSIQDIWGIYFRKGTLDKNGTSDATDDVIIWEPYQNISNNAGHPMFPTIATVDGLNIYVVWYDHDPVTNPNAPQDIFFTKSTDGGVTWEPYENISNNVGESLRPKIAVDRPNITYAVWHDNTTDDGNYEIFFKKSLDGGVTWEEPYQNISNNSGDSVKPSIAVNGSTFYVIWQDNTYCSVRNPEGDNEVFFTRSTDGGVTWDPYRNISNNTGNSMTWGISITVDGSNLYVVWSDDTYDPEYEDDIFFTKSTNGGDTWEEPKEITDTTGWSHRPSMAVDGDNIYVVWQDNEYDPVRNPDKRNEAFFIRSTNGGETWDEEPVYLSKGMCPVIATNGSYLYVVIGMGSFAWSKDYGVTWEPVTTGLWGLEPFIAVDGSNLYVVWEQGRDRVKEVFFRKGTLIDDVVTWDTIVNLSNNAGDSRFPTIAVIDGDDLYVVWYDCPARNPGRDNEILFRSSTDDGVTWDPPRLNLAKNISDNSGDSLRPKIVVQ